MDNRDVAKRWFNKGNNDLSSGKYLFTMPNPPTDIICFHSQQAAEKYLKGFLVFHDLEAPRIHGIEELISMCVKIDSDYEITVEEAQHPIDIAGKFKKFVLTKLKLS